MYHRTQQSASVTIWQQTWFLIQTKVLLLNKGWGASSKWTKHSLIFLVSSTRKDHQRQWQLQLVSSWSLNYTLLSWMHLSWVRPQFFYTSVQNNFPTDISKLMQQLTWVCDWNKEHRRYLNDLASTMGLKKVASGNQVRMNTAAEVIPRSAKGKRRGRTPAAASSATCIWDTGSATWGWCALCKKYLPSTYNAWKKHPTKDCRKWKRDSTSEPFQCGNDRGNGNDNSEPHG